MGVREIDRFLEQWQMDARDLHRRLILAPPPRERALRQAQEMARHLAAGPRMDGLGYGAGLGTGSAHHRKMGRHLWRGRACCLDFRAVRWFPPGLGETQQAELKATVQELPAMAGIELANWNWKAIHQFVSERFGISLSRSGCLNYLHRLGFAFKRPKKRLLKANEAKRRPSRRNTPPCGTRRGALAARYSSLTRPISGLTRSCGASGC